MYTLLLLFVFVMIPPPPISTRTDTTFPLTTRFRSEPATGLKSTPTFQDRLSSLRLVSPRMLSKASGRCPFSTPISGLPLASVSGSIALVQSPGCRGVDAPRPTRDLANVWIMSNSLRWASSPCIGSKLLRSEEHTSELQSLMRISYAVFCLKKKKQTITKKHEQTHGQTEAT